MNTFLKSTKTEFQNLNKMANLPNIQYTERGLMCTDSNGDRYVLPVEGIIKLVKLLKHENGFTSESADKIQSTIDVCKGKGMEPIPAEQIQRNEFDY